MQQMESLTIDEKQENIQSNLKHYTPLMLFTY